MSSYVYYMYVRFFVRGHLLFLVVRKDSAHCTSPLNLADDTEDDDDDDSEDDDVEDETAQKEEL